MNKSLYILSVFAIMSCKINQPDNLIFAWELLNERTQDQCNLNLKDFRFTSPANRLNQDFVPTVSLTPETEEIQIHLPYGSVNRAISSFELEGNGSLYLDGVRQESGVTAIDFTDSKNFDLVGDNDSSCTKSIRVSVLPITPVVDTGIRFCYDQSAILPDNPTSCSDPSNAYRQDGVWTDVPNARAWSDPEQITTDAGIVRDRLTGLIWRKCSRGQNSAMNCSGTADVNTLAEAKSFCSDFMNNFDDGNGYGGFKNWRLPTVHELSSIINRSNLNSENGLLDSHLFPGSSGDNSGTNGYWTINEDAGNSNNIWRIHFEYNAGDTSYHHIQTRSISSATRRVRCVSSPMPPTKSLQSQSSGIIRDNLTQLDWDQCAFGQILDGGVCSGAGDTMNWVTSLESCSKKGDGWRLPNINELMSLYDYNRMSPGIDTSLFNGQPTASSAYWSSTTNPQRIDEAFFQEFNGFVEVRSKGAHFLARCVRTSVD